MSLHKWHGFYVHRMKWSSRPGTMAVGIGYKESFKGTPDYSKYHWALDFSPWHSGYPKYGWGLRVWLGRKKVINWYGNWFMKTSPDFCSTCGGYTERAPDFPRPEAKFCKHCDSDVFYCDGGG